jgi:glutathione S-transferase
LSLHLYFHPLSSFCQKALVALYENDTPFEPRFINLGDEAAAAELRAIWPMTRFPVLRDKARGLTVPESTIIIEYLAQHYPGSVDLVPKDPDAAMAVRLQDRIFDLYVMLPMQRIVGDKLRPADAKDPHGVAEAKRQLTTTYDMLEVDLTNKTWAAGSSFSMADCAAAPSLFYANLVHSFGTSHPSLAAYFDRLTNRPSFARVVEEAKPYFSLFPG